MRGAGLESEICQQLLAENLISYGQKWVFRLKSIIDDIGYFAHIKWTFQLKADVQIFAFRWSRFAVLVARVRIKLSPQFTSSTVILAQWESRNVDQAGRIQSGGFAVRANWIPASHARRQEGANEESARPTTARR